MKDSRKSAIDLEFFARDFGRDKADNFNKYYDNTSLAKFDVLCDELPQDFRDFVVQYYAAPTNIRDFVRSIGMPAEDAKKHIKTARRIFNLPLMQMRLYSDNYLASAEFKKENDLFEDMEVKLPLHLSLLNLAPFTKRMHCCFYDFQNIKTLNTYLCIDRFLTFTTPRRMMMALMYYASFDSCESYGGIIGRTYAEIASQFNLSSSRIGAIFNDMNMRTRPQRYKDNISSYVDMLSNTNCAVDCVDWDELYEFYKRHLMRNEKLNEGEWIFINIE